MFIQTAYKSGRQAYHLGMIKSQNPYKKGGQFAVAWLRGYLASFAEDTFTANW